MAMSEKSEWMFFCDTGLIFFFGDMPHLSEQVHSECTHGWISGLLPSAINKDLRLSWAQALGKTASNLQLSSLSEPGWCSMMLNGDVPIPWCWMGNQYNLHNYLTKKKILNESCDCICVHLCCWKNPKPQTLNSYGKRHAYSLNFF